LPTRTQSAESMASPTSASTVIFENALKPGQANGASAHSLSVRAH
jgi:hypothetical protein